MGEVEAVRPAGKLITASLALAGSKKSITLIAAPDAGLAAGKSAAVLGVIVEHPRDDLAGYVGDDAPVVWSNLAVPMP